MKGSPSSTPQLSIVVVPFGGPRLLAGCLEALAKAGAKTSDDAEIEIIVPTDDGEPLAELARRFPRVRFARVAGRRSWAELRAAGVRLSSAPIVALTEAQCRPAEDWAARLLAAHRSPAAAIGGVVGKRRGSATGWAMYFCDYARYAPPRAAGPAATLTDCNVSYKRAALDAIAPLWSAEFHEPTVHGALIGGGGAGGEPLWLEPRAVVWHRRAPRLGEALTDRYRFGRLFGATRAAEISAGRRRLLIAACALVPWLIVLRAGAEALPRRRLTARWILALPLMLLLASAWGLGELVGTVTRRGGGDASRRPRPGAGA